MEETHVHKHMFRAAILLRPFLILYYSPVAGTESLSQFPKVCSADQIFTCSVPQENIFCMQYTLLSTNTGDTVVNKSNSLFSWSLYPDWG